MEIEVVSERLNAVLLFILQVWQSVGYRLLESGSYT